ncbi:hypothetical protein [Burkholderia gladioli]|uniref:hypothetical protein n=1 Tax=Burkholderia gladioli TaxID=28095 RepID=UPI0016411005|nr:hypothetical protein [Burkholderia gladioli]
MQASPGDFGIEGWTADGHAFQCYCPEKDYTQSELHDAVRDKITTDIPKLNRYAKEIKARIGDTKIHSWMFVTPVIPHNDIHKHARKKEAEARAWRCSILESNFSIFIQDAEHYATQFEESRRSQGGRLHLGPTLPRRWCCQRRLKRFKGLWTVKIEFGCRARPTVLTLSEA